MHHSSGRHVLPPSLPPSFLSTSLFLAFGRAILFRIVKSSHSTLLPSLPPSLLPSFPQLPHVLWGGLLGGPESDDSIVMDGCPDFMHMEVALDFNAGFTSAVAAMKHLSLQGIHL